MTDEHCPNCGAKTIWSERVEGTDSNFECGCPRCLLHIRIHNGHVEVTRPAENKLKPEPRKPREWWVHVKTGEIRSCLSNDGIYSNSIQDETIRVREVID